MVDNTDVDWMPPPPLGSSHQYQAAAGVHPLAYELNSLEYPSWVAGGVSQTLLATSSNAC